MSRTLLTPFLCLLLSCFAGASGVGVDSGFGDLVYSYDTLTGEVTQKEVTSVFAPVTNHINYLTILDEQGNVQVIESTDVHPFWVVTDTPDLSRAARSVVDENGVTLYHENLQSGLNGFWVEAKDLRVGDVFLGANGELSVLVSAERVVFPEGIKVYNFTVDGNHNYFVIAKCDEFGQTCVLVHNAVKEEYGAGKPNKIEVCSTDVTGKVHGNLPNHVPKSWTHADFQDAKVALERSIIVRKAEQIRLGEHGPHRARIATEGNLLKMIIKKLSGT